MSNAARGALVPMGRPKPVRYSTRPPYAGRDRAYVARTQIRLLGTVGIAAGGEIRGVAGERRTAVLAALALAHGEVVGTDRLVEAVCGTGPPATALNTLQQHVSHLRRARRGRHHRRPPGYVLRVDGDSDGDATDVARADRLIRATAEADDARERVRLLRAAVALS
nr:hypothetical protein GCM10020063_053240 [Dactylosporangium thailandense]